MVRIMGLMIGLMVASVSSTVRSLYSNVHQGRGKLSSKDGGAIGVPESFKYDEPNLELYPYSTYKGISPLRHLMEIPNGTCIPPSIDEFPPDFFNQEQRSKGGLVVHFILGAYACYGLAAICDIYFVPSLQLISSRLGLSSDVAGATFMAAGTSSPEFFESIIGSFITEGDIGVGTIVGSAVFNILAVTAVCGLLAGKVVPIDWWPLTRDCLFYTLSVIALVIIIYDGKVYWYEATSLLVMFCFYVLMMRFNRKLSAYFHSFSCCVRQEKRSIAKEANHAASITKVETDLMKNIATDVLAVAKEENGFSKVDVEATRHVLLDEHRVKSVEEELEENEFYLATLPEGCLAKVLYILGYPMNLLFYLTIPNCSKPRWAAFYPLTFVMSVVYIGSLSYFVAWMVTIIGYTVGVPDTVMGITFLAIGTSIPEAYTSVIVCRKGFGNMAMSNCIGSNVFDILFCLGLPWLIKATAFSVNGFVQINSSGLVYSTLSLLATVVILYAVLIAFKFRINVKVGITCFLMYSAFLVFASLVEMNIFGIVNPPPCVE